MRCSSRCLTRKTPRGLRTAPLSAVAGPHDRFLRRIMEHIDEFVPVVQLVDLPAPELVGAVDIPDVLEQMFLPEIPQVQVVEQVARASVPQMVVPLVDGRRSVSNGRVSCGDA